ncbi:MAG: PLP-dependent aminotransferase family protein [Vicinamibacteraceae bacterium]|nr:PLP-dependent aminotransferase family protein [Vicinamibacteraceae bacterium]
MSFEHLLSRAGERMQQSAIRQMGTVAASLPDVISFAPGYPAPETFAWDDYRTIADDVLSGADGTALQYGPTRGFGPLLDTLVSLLAARGITSTVEQLQLTTGSQQGLDLVARVLLDPGDVALVELPSYTGALTAFRNVMASLVGVRRDDEGIDLDHLETTVARLSAEGRRVKFLYLVPNFQNPTGALMSLARRRAVLDWALRRDLIIVEDDPYGALYFEDTTSPDETRPIKADDRDGRVIYLSSFSKTLSPAFRVAWVTAHPSLAARFETAKQALDLCTGNFDQRMVYESCRRGVLDRQVPKLRAFYQRNRTVMQEALRERLGDRITWAIPRGGFFLWASLPEGVDTMKMLDRAMRHRVIYVAGSPFFVDGSGQQTLRLAFSFVQPARLVEGVERLSTAIMEELETIPKLAAKQEG